MQQLYNADGSLNYDAASKYLCQREDIKRQYRASRMGTMTRQRENDHSQRMGDKDEEQEETTTAAKGEYINTQEGYYYGEESRRRIMRRRGIYEGDYDESG